MIALKVWDFHIGKIYTNRTDSFGRIMKIILLNNKMAASASRTSLPDYVALYFHDNTHLVNKFIRVIAILATPLLLHFKLHVNLVRNLLNFENIILLPNGS